MRRWWMTGPLFAVAFLVVGCGGDDVPVEDAGVVESEEEPEPAAEPEVEPEAESSSGTEPAAEAGGEEASSAPAGEGDGSLTPAEAGEGAALPTQEALEDPCAEHAGREEDVFIDLVAPVNEQQVGDHVDVVGCANVNEGTVSYRVLDGDGRTLDEGFVTAECGTGCVGEFRDSIELSAAEGEPVAYLQFFSESMADGSEQALTEVIVSLE